MQMRARRSLVLPLSPAPPNVDAVIYVLMYTQGALSQR